MTHPLFSNKPWGGMGEQFPQLNDFVLPCLPTTLNRDPLVSCYCLFYVNDYRLKLSNDIYKGTFSGIVGNVVVKVLSGGKPPEPLCYLPYRSGMPAPNLLTAGFMTAPLPLSFFPAYMHTSSFPGFISIILFSRVLFK